MSKNGGGTRGGRRGLIKRVKNKTLLLRQSLLKIEGKIRKGGIKLGKSMNIRKIGRKTSSRKFR